ELIPVLRVLDAEVESTLRQTDQRGRGQHPPFVERVLVGRNRLVPARENNTVARRVTRGEGRGSDVRGGQPEWLGAPRDELTALDADDETGNRSRRYERPLA